MFALLNSRKYGKVFVDLNDVHGMEITWSEGSVTRLWFKPELISATGRFYIDVTETPEEIKEATNLTRKDNI